MKRNDVTVTYRRQIARTELERPRQQTEHEFDRWMELANKIAAEHAEALAELSEQ